MDTRREGEGGRNWEHAIKHRKLSSVLCDDLDGWEGWGGGGRWGEVQAGGDVGIHRADSHFCTAETNTTL